MSTTVTVRVPASTANLGPGFDSLGMALDLHGELTLTVRDEPALFPSERGKRLALAAARAVWQHAGQPAPRGLVAAYSGEIPIGRGLGASAVLRVGAVVAANELIGRRFDREELLLLATELEGHADNATPAMFGGLQVVVWSDRGVEHVRVPVPAALRCVVFVPDLDMPTSEARKLLPAELTRRECVYNIGRTALLVAALATGDLQRLRTATQDALHQPARTAIFPAMPELFAAALDAGACGAFLSGAGSGVMAFVDGDALAEPVGRAMSAAATAHELTGRTIYTCPGERGAEVTAGP